jgi:hypothetical protein
MVWACAGPLALSSLTIIQPSAGSVANATGSTDSATAALAPGARSSRVPWEIAGANGSNVAVAGRTSAAADMWKTIAV